MSVDCNQLLVGIYQIRKLCCLRQICIFCQDVEDSGGGANKRCRLDVACRWLLGTCPTALQEDDGEQSAGAGRSGFTHDSKAIFFTLGGSA